ncbi:MAG: S-layer homology domain-containing protein [Oscillospiraceae bacterium]
MRKKVLSLVLCVAMMASMLTIPALAAEPGTTAAPEVTFTDTAGHWGVKAIDRWAKVGVVKGDGGKFSPDGNLTRAAMATILTNLLGLTVMAPNTYADVSATAWYADAVLKCTAAGILKGDGVNAKPDDDISRQEAMIMLARALGIQPAQTADLTAFTDADQVATWAADYVTAMTKSGIVGGVGGDLVAPMDNMNRASVVTVLDKAISDYITAAGTYDKVVGTGIVVATVPGIVLKNSNIAGSLLVAEGVGDGDLTLDSTNVAGKMTVRGGGVNSIIIKGGSKLGDVTIARVDGAVRVVTSGDSTIEATCVDDGKDHVIFEGKLSNLSVACDVPIILRGADVKTVTATGKNADITVDKDSKVVTVATAQENTNITVAGTVTNVGATVEATGVSLNVAKGGTATNVTTAASGSVIKNDGNLGALGIAKGADTVFAKGENATKTTITAADKADLGVTTIAAQEAKEAVAKAAADELAAEQAAAKAAEEKAVAEKLAAEAQSEEEKAAAAKAQEDAAAKEAAAKVAADKAAADKAVADKAQSDSKKEEDKVKEEIKVEEKPVTPPVVGEDGEIIVPKPKPKPRPNPSIPESEIDAIITQGIDAVKPLVAAYAAVGTLSADNMVTITINADDASKNTLVTTAYTAIVGTLVTKLDASHTTVASITVEGQTLPLDGSVTVTEIHDFVKSIPSMIAVSGTTTITSLVSHSIIATANTVYGQQYTYTIAFVQGT